MLLKLSNAPKSFQDYINKILAKKTQRICHCQFRKYLDSQEPKKSFKLYIFDFESTKKTIHLY